MECLWHNEKESLEKWHRSQHVNSQELGIYPATLPFFFFYRLNFRNNISASTPWLYRCTSGHHKPKMMCGVEGWFGSLCCHWSTWATITVRCFWSFSFMVIDSWKMSDRTDLLLKKLVKDSLRCYLFIYLFFEIECRRMRLWTKKQTVITGFHAVIYLSIKESRRKESWLIGSNFCSLFTSHN